MDNTPVALPLYAAMTSGNRLVSHPDQIELPDDLEGIDSPTDIQLPSDLEEIQLPSDLEDTSSTQTTWSNQEGAGDPSWKPMYPTEQGLKGEMGGLPVESVPVAEQLQGGLSENPSIQLQELQRRLNSGFQVPRVR